MTDKQTPAVRSGAQEEDSLKAKADVGIVYSLKLEMSPFLSRCDRVKKYTGGDFTFRGGFLRDIRVAFVETGPGAEKAQRGTHALIDAHAPQWIISAGFSGGLDPELQIGDIVVGNHIVAAEAEDPSSGLKIDFKMKPDPKKGLHVGKLATAGHIVRTVDEKRQTAERTGAIAVDMESLAVAEVCRERKVKFLSIRGISDDCSADLPAEVLSVLGGTGSIRAGAVVGALWNRPTSYKALWRLRQNANLAADRLALFLSSILRQIAEPSSW